MPEVLGGEKIRALIKYDNFVKLASKPLWHVGVYMVYVYITILIKKR